MKYQVSFPKKHDIFTQEKSILTFTALIREIFLNNQREIISHLRMAKCSNILCLLHNIKERPRGLSHKNHHCYSSITIKLFLCHL